MIHRFRCSGDHVWEVSFGPADGTLDAGPACPTCGLAGRMIAHQVEQVPLPSGEQPTIEGSHEHAPSMNTTPPSIPGYEILDELGRGGMGVVYRARQVQLNRVVALKMILAGGHASSADQARFLTEARAVASLQHPNIVQLHDSGHHQGLPYFTLEFVAGGSLADLVRDHPLAPMVAARLVQQIALGVAAAHTQGIVHRDLKPENVLMSHDGTPKITDFGLAKKVEGDSGLTRTGALMGTPSYMAPEQAQGQRDVGAAADIYALGGILYRLVTGRPPFQAATPLDTVMQVVSQEPVAPRQLNPQVPRDLETIILKCLLKEPGRRYASAQELASDLKRLLNNEPILARPIGMVGRVVRWVKRNPRVAALLAVLGMTLATGFVIVFVAWRIAVREHRRAVDYAQQAQTQEARAKANLLKAIEAVDRMLTRVVDERLAYVPQFEDERRRILEEAVQFFHDFLEQESDDPDLNREIGRAYFRLGKVFQGLGQHQKSMNALEQARRVQEELIVSQPVEPRHRDDLAQTLIRLGIVHRMLNQSEQAAPHYERALSLCDELLLSNPHHAGYLKTRAMALNQLGNQAFQNRDLDRAESFLKRSLVEWDAVVQATPDDFENLIERTKARAMLANFQQTLRKPEAEQSLQLIVAELEGMQKRFPNREKDIDPVLAEARLNLGSLLAESNRTAQADELIRRGLRTYDKLVADYPLMPGYRYTLARGHQAAAVQGRALRKPEQTEQALLKAIGLLEELARDNSGTFYHSIALRRTLQELAQLYRGQSQPEKALDIMKKATASAGVDAEKAPRSAPIHLEFLRMTHQYAELFRELERFDEARKEIESALNYARNRVAPGAELTEVTNYLRATHAMVLAQSGDYRSAEEEASRLLDAKPRDQVPMYNAACIYSRCAESVRKDDRLPVSARVAQSQRFLTRAWEQIKELKTVGYFRPPARVRQLRRDRDLQALRESPGFKQWMEQNLPLNVGDK